MDHHSGNRDRPQRRGFRGTAENAKTKICMRYVGVNGGCRWGMGRFGTVCVDWSEWDSASAQSSYKLGTNYCLVDGLVYF